MATRIDRDPARVAEDVRRGLVTAEAAQTIYGVAVTGDGWEVPATEVRRLEIRSERIGRVAERSWATRADVTPTGRPLGEYLQQPPTARRSARGAGIRSLPPKEPWKASAVAVRSPMQKAGSRRSTDPDFFLVEYCCPSCATLLDSEVVWRDDPPLHDRPTSWPGE